jgi:hypothetical protein
MSDFGKVFGRHAVLSLCTAGLRGHICPMVESAPLHEGHEVAPATDRIAE